jgi:hypothetical protein
VKHDLAESCADRRILFYHPPVFGRPNLDGFTLELQMMGRFLQVAVATDRTLVLPDNFQSAYASLECTNSSSWNCLYHPLSECTHQTALPVKTKLNRERIQRNIPASLTVTASLGIIHDNNHDGSPYFDTKYYGTKRIIDEDPYWLGDPSSNVDRIDSWERRMGRFWIRSQLAHYLWKPSFDLESQMQPRMPGISSRYIGMHVRFSDNIGSLERDFGRNATVTRSVHHYMKIADTIRSQTDISTLYVATDSTNVLEELHRYNIRHARDKWTLHVQNGKVERTDGQDWTWFKDTRGSSAAAVATDVELLRQADYLIGSFQSNVYRLVAELNTAYHVNNYPWSMHRHYTVDNEWYEDP